MEQTTKYSRLVWLACLLFVATSGCGKPLIYHFEHYNRPFAAIAKSNQTYFHSQKSGKIIPKDSCAGYCEPGCFGYEPTTWSHWPQECPGSFPVQGETFVAGDGSYETSSETVMETPTDAMGFYSAEEDVLMIGDGPVIPDHAPDAPAVSYTKPTSTESSVKVESSRAPRSIVVPQARTQGSGVPAPSITIPSDLESSGPSPSDGTNSSPELPQLPFTRLEPPTTKLPTDSADIAVADEESNTEETRSSSDSKNQDKTASHSSPAVKLAEMPPTVQPHEEPQFQTIEIKAAPMSDESAGTDNELAVRILVPQSPKLVTAPVPSKLIPANSREQSVASAKLQDAQLRNNSVSKRMPVVANVSTTVGTNQPVILQTAAEKPISKPTTRKRSAVDSSNQPRIDDKLFSTGTLRRPKKIRVDKLPVKPQPLRLNLHRMTPSGLPLAKKVSPKKAPAQITPTQKAAPQKATAEKVTPKKPALSESKPIRPATKVAAKPATQSTGQKQKEPAKIASKGVSPLTTMRMTTGVAMHQHMSQPILKQSSQPLAKPGQLRVVPPAKNLAKRTNAQPLPQKLAKSSKTQKAGVWKNPTARPTKSTLGFNEAKSAKKLATKPTEKPAVSVSLTVSEEASSMIQFAKDPPRREVRVSSVPDGGPSVRFR